MGYFDNAATTPLLPQVKEYIIELLDNYGNPSSTVYTLGSDARDIINKARESVANFIHAKPSQITFTSSGSAANTLGIMGWVKNRKKTDSLHHPIFYSSVCHKSIRLCAMDNKGVPIIVDSKGVIKESDLKTLLLTNLTYLLSPLVVLSMADSEIGTIQNIKKLTELCHFYNATVMVDVTGYIPSYEVDVNDLDCDILTFSGHKLGAMKGVGVLYKKDNIELSPLVYGSQENGLFGGTENVIGIASLGKSCEIYKDKYKTITNNQIEYLWSLINKSIPDVKLIGPNIDNRLPHNLFISIKGVVGEDLILLMDEQGYQISAGSACNTGSLIPSPTLVAIGLTGKEASSCIRITLSGEETKQELDDFCKELQLCVERLRWVRL